MQLRAMRAQPVARAGDRSRGQHAELVEPLLVDGEHGCVGEAALGEHRLQVGQHLVGRSRRHAVEHDADLWLFVTTANRYADAVPWRLLEGVVWSDFPPVQVTAIRLLRRLASEGAGWAADTLDAVVLEPDVQKWADKA